MGRIPVGKIESIKSEPLIEVERGGVEAVTNYVTFDEDD